MSANLPRKGRAVDGQDSPDSLTQEERDVLERIAGGTAKRDVALSLGLSEETIDAHVTNVIAKLHRNSDPGPKAREPKRGGPKRRRNRRAP